VGDELVRRPVIVEGLALLAEIVAQQVLLIADRKNRVRVLAELTLRIKQRKNSEKRIEDNTLVALTIMIAESKPDEKELIINLVMNFLKE